MSFQYTTGDPDNLTGGTDANMVDIQGPFIDLKEYLNNRIAAIPVVVSVLPASPVNGQEVYYVADAPTGVIWHLRYNAGSSSPYKWEFLGGSSLYSPTSGTSGVAGTGSSFGDITGGNGPDIVVPLAGDYACDFGAACLSALGFGVGSNVAVGLTGSAGPASQPTLAVTFGVVGNNFWAQGWGSGVLTALTPGQTVRMRYLYTVDGTLTYTERRFCLRPRRVG